MLHSIFTYYAFKPIFTSLRFDRNLIFMRAWIASFIIPVISDTLIIFNREHFWILYASLSLESIILLVMLAFYYKLVVSLHPWANVVEVADQCFVHSILDISKVCLIVYFYEVRESYSFIEISSIYKVVNHIATHSWSSLVQEYFLIISRNLEHSIHIWRSKPSYIAWVFLRELDLIIAIIFFRIVLS